MNILNKKEAVILFFGDVLTLLFALWLTLGLRYLAAPSSEVLSNHLLPFSLLFAVWIAVFFIAGLYEKHTLILKSRLPIILINVQLINIVIAVIFFYLVPYFGITPKTNLFIYLIVSSVLIMIWRIYGAQHLGFRRKQKAILIGSGEEMKELREEVNNNPRYNLEFVSSVDLDDIDSVDFEDEILNMIYSENISTIVIDMRNEKIMPILPRLYNLIFSKVRFIDMYRVYEDIFDRIPLSLIGYNWFLENISAPHLGYDFLKRIMDITISFFVGILSLFLYPLVYIMIKFDDGGPVFFRQERVGKNNAPISILKFRSMGGESKGGGIEDKPKVTRAGNVLRKLRIDELPQLWNVLRGDISLVGPRPEIPSLVKIYEKTIPYYDIRHLIKPGLSGWAQIYHKEHPHHSANVVETKKKLSYDLYYIKNRSFILDLKIALKTIKTILSRSGV